MEVVEHMEVVAQQNARIWRGWEIKPLSQLIRRVEQECVHMTLW